MIPLQMAEVAAAVADHGRLMAPRLTDRIVDAEGRTVERISPRVQSVVMRPSSASAVTVDDGSGRQRRHRHRGADSRRPGGGQDGTAETQIGTAINNVWFIAFAPAANPTVAIAVTLQGVPGQGAAFAAPVAKQVMEQLLHD